MKTRFLLPAQYELNEAVHYYNAQRALLGNDFRDEAWNVIQRINDFPLAWFSLGDNIRRCQMHRFPYGIIYEPLSSEVVIIAVAHLHQKPGYWQSRIRRI